MIYGPPEESNERQEQVSTLVNNLRNVEGDVETGPCGEHCILFKFHGSRLVFTTFVERTLGNGKQPVSAVCEL